jgi:hypothetical protein
MWYTILVTLIVDIGGLLLIYALLRDRVRRATTAQAQIADIREEVSRLLVELNQATDRNIALMEDKIASLNGELAAADKKIGLLHREIEKHDVGTQIYSRLAEGRTRAGQAVGAAAASAESRRAESAESRRAESADFAAPQMRGTQPAAGFGGARAAGSEAESAPTAGRAAGRAAAPLAVELSEVPDRSADAEQRPLDLQSRVLMLHRAGFAASLIASRVGIPLGEVELIISLEQRKGQA